MTDGSKKPMSNRVKVSLALGSHGSQGNQSSHKCNWTSFGCMDTLSLVNRPTLMCIFE